MRKLGTCNAAANAECSEVRLVAEALDELGHTPRIADQLCGPGENRLWI
jgi:hypothetical protein